jgi:hypothetical protein
VREARADADEARGERAEREQREEEEREPRRSSFLRPSASAQPAERTSLDAIGTRG